MTLDQALESAADGVWNYQSLVNDWMQACFGPEISADKTERNHRFLEEALELVQSIGCTQSEAHQLIVSGVKNAHHQMAASSRRTDDEVHMQTLPIF